MECEYCDTILQSKYSLAKHQLTAKYCLLQQDKLKDNKYVCKFCNKTFKKEEDNSLSTIEVLDSQILKLETENTYLQKRIKEFEESNICLKQDNNSLDKEPQPRKKISTIFWEEYNKRYRLEYFEIL